MTKTEERMLLAKLTAAETELRMLRAMRITESVEPDIAPPEDGQRDGWMVRCWGNEYRVEKASTAAHLHLTGTHAWKVMESVRIEASQGGRYLYSTESLATRAARSELSKSFARTLANLDARIVKLESGEPE